MNEDLLDQRIVARIDKAEQEIISSVLHPEYLDIRITRQQARDKVFRGSLEEGEDK